MKKKIFLMGPTASGKTEAAKIIFDNFPVEIISVDSAQIYKGFNIGSAKPKPNELIKYPHYLVDRKGPCDRYSVNEFKLDVEEVSSKIYKKNKVPMLVGGTMMYFNSLERPLNEMPGSTPEARKKINDDLNKYGLDEMYKKLSRIDPVIVEKIKGTDKQRIMRALEVYYISGKPLSFYHIPKVKPLTNCKLLKIALIPADKTLLNNRIEIRVNDMLKNGFIEEVESLLKNNPGLDLTYPALRSVGYKQIYEYLMGMISFDMLSKKIIIATRQLAKRQMTWIRAMENLLAVDPFDKSFNIKINNRVKEFLKE
ncbi:MAG: tRNA (adenosine(37)-N6)-dimethylallyltransferase MiaA [Methylophilaceae bacterium]|nr:tRNA (adenosine(37)-N6)-dimethylallyltransferase MiaA [Methylophilaceae bacterium]